MAKLRDSGMLSQFQRAGALKMMTVHGKAKLSAKVAEWRRKNPSGPERELHQLLRYLGIDVLCVDYTQHANTMPLTAYTEHMPFSGDNDKPYILDVAWPGLKIGLEVDGPVHDLFTSPERQLYAIKRAAQLDTAGWKVYSVQSKDLRNDYGMSVLVECIAKVQSQSDVYKNVFDALDGLELDDEVPY